MGASGIARLRVWTANETKSWEKSQQMKSVDLRLSCAEGAQRRQVALRPSLSVKR